MMVDENVGIGTAFEKPPPAGLRGEVGGNRRNLRPCRFDDLRRGLFHATLIDPVDDQAAPFASKRGRAGTAKAPRRGTHEGLSAADPKVHNVHLLRAKRI